MTLSPAERYAAARERRTTTTAAPRLEEFRERIEFPLDDFQLAACRALEGGHSVLVAAPTGAMWRIDRRLRPNVDPSFEATPAPMNVPDGPGCAGVVTLKKRSLVKPALWNTPTHRLASIE